MFFLCLTGKRTSCYMFPQAGNWEESPEDLDEDYDEVDACVSPDVVTEPKDKTICIPKECDFIHVYSPVTFGMLTFWLLSQLFFPDVDFHHRHT